MNSEKVNRSGFRVVPDTNVILASKLAKSQKSPNREFIDRWLNREFLILYSTDTRIEYVKKLQEKGIATSDIFELLESLFVLGEKVTIHYFHLLDYPTDTEDIRFLLCAENGGGTHLVSYDQHLLELQGKFSFKIIKLIPFLKELRAKIG